MKSQLQKTMARVNNTFAIVFILRSPMQMKYAAKAAHGARGE